VNRSSFQQKLKSTAKAKIKQILNIDSTNSTSSVNGSNPHVEKSVNGAAQKKFETPAFDSAKFLKKSEDPPTGVRDKTTTAFRVAANALIHPKDTIKSSDSRVTARHLAKSRSANSKEANLE
jgi:hypothetical protein